MPSMIEADGVSSRTNRRTARYHTGTDRLLFNAFTPAAVRRYVRVVSSGIEAPCGAILPVTCTSGQRTPPALQSLSEPMPLLPQSRRPASPLTGGQAAPGD